MCHQDKLDNDEAVDVVCVSLTVFSKKLNVKLEVNSGLGKYGDNQNKVLLMRAFNIPGRAYTAQHVQNA